jgi:hypothetical protein
MLINNDNELLLLTFTALITLDWFSISSEVMKYDIKAQHIRLTEHSI